MESINEEIPTWWTTGTTIVDKPGIWVSPPPPQLDIWKTLKITKKEQPKIKILQNHSSILKYTWVIHNSIKQLECKFVHKSPPPGKKIPSTPMGWASLLDRARKLLCFDRKILWKMVVLESNKK
jgi:hypothetical protein